MVAKLYTQGLLKIISRHVLNPAPTSPEVEPVEGSIKLNEGGTPTAPAPKDTIDLLNDDIRFALVDTSATGTESGRPATAPTYAFNAITAHSHLWLSDIIGTVTIPPEGDGEPTTASRPVQWGGSTEITEIGSTAGYSPVIRTSPPLTLRTIKRVTATVPDGDASPYYVIQFDCGDSLFKNVPVDAPKSEAVVLYKHVPTTVDLVGTLPEGDPLELWEGSPSPTNLNANLSPLIAYFDGAQVSLVPNGSDVSVVISANGLMRWGIGSAGIVATPS